MSNLFEHSQGALPIVNNISLFLSIPFSLLLSSPSYAKIHIPIIASVSEHQPTTWVSFFFDLHILVCTFPAGLWFCIKNINDERVFGRKILLLFRFTAVFLCAFFFIVLLNFNVTHVFTSSTKMTTFSTNAEKHDANHLVDYDHS